MEEISPLKKEQIEITHTVSSIDAVTDYFNSLMPTTREAYNKDLREFGIWLGHEKYQEVLPNLMLHDNKGQVNNLVLRWKGEMLEKGVSPSTINRRLSALRAMVYACKLGGIIDWDIDIRGVKGKKYKDTAGPGRDGVEAMLIEAGKNPKKIQRLRNTLIVRLLWDWAFREMEIWQLNIENINIAANSVTIRGKGDRETTTLQLTEALSTDLKNWLEEHPQKDRLDAPLLIALDNTSYGDRLTARSIHRITTGLGKKAGLDPQKCRPHGIRHASITQAAIETNGDVVAVSKFSRHKKKETVFVYLDNLNNPGKDIANKVSNSIKKEPHE